MNETGGERSARLGMVSFSSWFPRVRYYSIVCSVCLMHAILFHGSCCQEQRKGDFKLPEEAMMEVMQGPSTEVFHLSSAIVLVVPFFNSLFVYLSAPSYVSHPLSWMDC